MVAARTASAASSVCPSRTGADGLELAWAGVCPFGFAFPLAEGATPSPAQCPAGPREGHPAGGGAPEGVGYGDPRTRGAGGEDGGAEGGGDGMEARRCGRVLLRPRPHRDHREEREGKGSGAGRAAGPPKLQPQPELTSVRCGEGGSHGGRTARQTASSYEY